jgi:hypothetical protein
MTVSQSSSSINSSQSHRSCSVAPLAPDRTQRRGWPHTAVKQDCRKVTHTSLVVIPAAANSTNHTTFKLKPLSTGWVRTHHSGVDGIAASCIPRVATAACAKGGGASEGRALGRIPSRSKSSCSQQHHHPIPHLQALQPHLHRAARAASVTMIATWRPSWCSSTRHAPRDTRLLTVTLTGTLVPVAEPDRCQGRGWDRGLVRLSIGLVSDAHRAQ